MRQAQVSEYKNGRWYSRNIETRSSVEFIIAFYLDRDGKGINRHNFALQL